METPITPKAGAVLPKVEAPKAGELAAGAAPKGEDVPAPNPLPPDCPNGAVLCCCPVPLFNPAWSRAAVMVVSRAKSTSEPDRTAAGIEAKGWRQQEPAGDHRVVFPPQLLRLLGFVLLHGADRVKVAILLDTARPGNIVGRIIIKSLGVRKLTGSWSRCCSTKGWSRAAKSSCVRTSTNLSGNGGLLTSSIDVIS